jgi:hypothetical protein
MQEIEQVTETYINYMNEIRRTNSEKTIREFEQLRESISNRVFELEKFYETNIFDSRISSFEKARAKLKRLLKNETDGHDHDNPNLTFQKLNSDRSKNPNTNLHNISNSNNNNNNNEKNHVKSLETKKLSIEKIPVRKAFGFNGNSNAKKNRTASTDNKDRLKISTKEGKDKLNNSMVTNKKTLMKTQSLENKNNLDIATGKVNMSLDSSLIDKKLKPGEKKHNKQQTASTS